MIRPDDWQVTAYALGELSERERVDVETAAAVDPAVRAALDEATAAAGVLTTALRKELVADAGPALDSAQRAAILERAANGAPVLSLTARLRRWGLFAATAAAVMVGAFVWVRQQTPTTSGVADSSNVGERAYRYATVEQVAAELQAAQADRTNDVARLSKEARDAIEVAEKARIESERLVPTLADPLADQRSRFRLDALVRANPSGESDTPRANRPAAPASPPPVQGPMGAYVNGAGGATYGDLTKRLKAEVGSGGGGGGTQVWGDKSSGGGGGSGGGIRVLDVTIPGQPVIANAKGDEDGCLPGLATTANWNDAYRFIESDGTESYRSYLENAFLRAQAARLSTFSIDVDTASYSNLRRMIGEGHLPPADAVRLEELVNYFPYAYTPPTGADPFAVSLEVAGCPWNAKHRLVRVAIKGKDVARKERPASNLVFLLDVSGSMDAPNKLPLVKASIRMLLEELNERDTVAIVTYAGESGLALPPTSCEKKNTILEAVEKLVPSGSTNGASGISLAYDTAVASFIPGGLNRVVLCTDGDFNVGVTSHEELLKLVEAKAKSKVFLTALGFGMGNYKDDTLELLADKGNGNYGYVDSTREARKVLVDGASGTLMTIAKDVKVQVEFNPATVAGYRLVGYDNRLLATKDFNDDTKDAGEIGAGHTVTAFYEIVPVGVDEPLPEARTDVDPLRYGQPPAPAAAAPGVPAPPPPPAVPASAAVPSSDPTSRELLTVKLRFKAPEGDVSTKREFPLTDGGAAFDKASPDFQFASAVAAFALILKQSTYRGTASLDTVLELAGSSLGNDPGGWRAEFVDLVKKAKSLSGTK